MHAHNVRREAEKILADARSAAEQIARDSHARTEEARRTLSSIEPNADVDAELADMHRAISEERGGGLREMLRSPYLKATVFVVGPDNKAAQKTIRADRTQGDAWVVTGGLDGNERIITQGLNNLRAEVREMEAQRAALIDYLGLMSRKLLNLQNEAIANDPAAEARAADNADRELETELPELHTVPTPEAALDLSPETVARAVDELRAQAAAAGEEDEPETLSQPSAAPQEVEKQEEAAAPAEPAAVQPEEETPENAAPEAETEEQPKTEETPEPEKTEDKPDHPTGDPNHQTGPALTEVPGAIFSSPIVRPADAPRPDDTPPSATPMAPVMPSFEEEDELDAPAMPLPPREKPQEPEAEEEAPAVPEEPQPETPEAAKQRAARQKAMRALCALRRMREQHGLEDI